jgi:hypothetical protein
MKAKILLLSNLKEIEDAEKMALPKTPEPEYIEGVLHFRLGNVYHFYVERNKKGKREIVMMLYPQSTYRVKYNQALYKALDKAVQD